MQAYQVSSLLALLISLLALPGCEQAPVRPVIVPDRAQASKQADTKAKGASKASDSSSDKDDEELAGNEDDPWGSQPAGPEAAADPQVQAKLVSALTGTWEGECTKVSNPMDPAQFYYSIERMTVTASGSFEMRAGDFTDAACTQAEAAGSEDYVWAKGDAVKGLKEIAAGQFASEFSWTMEMDASGKLVSKATKVPTLLKIQGSQLTLEEVQDPNVTSFSAKAIVLTKK